MVDRERRFEENIAGAFYVDNECIGCHICSELAPKVFRESEDGPDHNVVFRQPETEEELVMAREALEECPVEAIGDDGMVNLRIVG